MTFPPATHNNDPVTAHEAEERHEKTGKRLLHRTVVLEIVNADPGLTAKEYGVLTGLGHHEAQRRLSDLTHTGEVVKAARAKYKGAWMTTWRTPGGGTQGSLF